MNLINEILALHRDVRFCGIINKEGEAVAMSMKQGVESLEPISKAPKLIVQFAILLGTDKSWDAYLGKTDFFLIHKSKVNLLLYPIKGSKGLLVSTDPSLPIDKLDGVRKAMTRYEKA